MMLLSVCLRLFLVQFFQYAFWSLILLFRQAPRYILMASSRIDAFTLSSLTFFCLVYFASDGVTRQILRGRYGDLFGK